MKDENHRTLVDKVLKTGLAITTAGMLAVGVYGGVQLYKHFKSGGDEVTAPTPIERESCRRTATRYERITICKNSDGAEIWDTQPHDEWGYGRGRSTTTHFPDGRITLYDWERQQEWEYSPSGVTLIDTLGNRFKVDK